MPDFTAAVVTQNQLLRAWPLVRTARPELAADQWLDCAGALLDRGGGVLALSAPDGCFHGVATYEPMAKLGIGRALEVDTFVTFELSRSAPARRALRNALERLAAMLGCTAVTVGQSARGYVPGTVRESIDAARPAEILRD